MVLTLLFSTLLAPAHAVSWPANQAPTELSQSYVYEFDKLPLSGGTVHLPWSDTYWPDQYGSIDNRWEAEPSVGFGFTPPTRVEAHLMTRDQLMRLSPAEKYDLLMGRYEYPLFNEVRKLPTVTSHAEAWDGICDGWSMASLQFAEPKPVDQMSADGILIPFGSSDVKAILSYAMSYHFENMDDVQAGEACTSGVCAGINAGTFHIALTNQVGLLKKGFIMDRSTTPEIWNQPIYAYGLQVVGSARPDIGVRGVHVKGVVFYSDELDHPSYTPVLGTNFQKTGTMQLDYTLDLDQNGRIIGGAFQRKSPRPDFIWFVKNEFRFTGYFAALSSIYHP